MPHDMFIGGQWTAGSSAGRRYDDVDPWSGQPFAQLPAGTPEDMRAAVEAADASFGAWSRSTPPQRQTIFLRAAALLEQRRDDVVAALVHETGAAHGFARFQVSSATASIRQAAGWPFLSVGGVYPSVVSGRTVFTVRQPLGPVLGVTPWNGAHVLAWRTVLTPLAFGNTVVLKPSEYASVSAGTLVGEILEEAGLPPGVLNVVTNAPGDGAGVIEAALSHDALRMMMFTGSSRTARVLAGRAGLHLKRTVLELGGYNPVIVLGDVDIDKAVESAVFSAFYHQGQICMNARKIIVDRSVADDFEERFVARAAALPTGDPSDPATFVGPLIHDEAAGVVEKQVAAAVRAGGRIATGGRRNQRLVHPTVLLDVPPEADAHQEEIFGPVVLLQRVDGPDEAVAAANSTRYGLSASILTGDSNAGLRLAQRVNAGMVQVNDSTMGGEPGLPNGGMKDSGWGYTGPVGMHDFTEIRQTSVHTEINAVPLP